MRRIVIFGNSGSGKSTMAAQEAARLGCPHFDLDTVAWAPGHVVPTRRALDDSARLLEPFLSAHSTWVIEGCYSSLLQPLLPLCTDLIFLKPGVETCVSNCRNRPWEPHKYASPADQEANLGMLLDWVEQYSIRTDEFSLSAHRALFDGFAGRKREYRSNARPEV